MLDPHESLKVNKRRQLLGATKGPGGGAEDRFFSFYDISSDCAHPRLLSVIDERDAKILRMRYGLDSGDPMTLKEIGEKVNLSRERVRQIEGTALARLRSLIDSRGLTMEDMLT